MWHSVLKQKGHGKRLSHKMKKGDKEECMENFMVLVIHTLPVLYGRLTTSSKT